MPRAKGHHDMLAPGLRFFLAHGRVADLNEDPSIPHGFGAGNFEAFMLWGRVLHLNRSDGRAVLDELQHLWHEHEAEIRATSGDAEPWVAQFLRETGDALLQSRNGARS